VYKLIPLSDIEVVEHRKNIQKFNGLSKFILDEIKYLFAIAWYGVYPAKLLICWRRMIGTSSIFSVYRNDSWVVERKFNIDLMRILWTIFAYSLGDSRCLCRACRTGRTWRTVMGGRLRIFYHHDLYYASIVTYMSAVGWGSSAKALVASDPYTV